MHRMKAITVGATALLALGAAAPAALASSPGSAAGITLTPSVVRPGDTVSIMVDCTAYNSPDPTGVSSQAFSTTVPLHPVPGQLGRYSAAATINDSIRPDDYSVSGACVHGNDQTSGFQATLTVSGRHHGSGFDHRSDFDNGISGPVRTGTGGSISSGSPAQIAVGAALVVSTGAVALWRRRRAVTEGASGGS